MAKGRGVTLKGAAAGAFIAAMRGDAAETVDDKALRVATFIHMEMKDRPQVAASLVKLVAEKGLDAAAKACTR